MYVCDNIKWYMRNETHLGHDYPRSSYTFPRIAAFFCNSSANSSESGHLIPMIWMRYEPTANDMCHKRCSAFGENVTEIHVQFTFVSFSHAKDICQVFTFQDVKHLNEIILRYAMCVRVCVGCALCGVNAKTR